MDLQICLAQYIKKAKSGDEDSTLKLIKQFHPLLSKYSRLLKYEDSYSDLLLALLEIIKNYPLSESSAGNNVIVPYIAKSIYHSYIALSKVQCSQNEVFLFSAYLTDDGECSDIAIDSLYPTYDEYVIEEIDLLSSILTEHETNVMIYLYIWNYNNKEVAKKLHVTPAAIAKTRKKAIDKLKQRFQV